MKKRSFLLVFIIFSVFFMNISSTKAIIPWKHSSVQVPFDGFWARYEGWWLNITDPLKLSYNLGINVLYEDTIPEQDYVIGFNSSIEYRQTLTQYYVWGRWNGTLDLTNGTVLEVDYEGNDTIQLFRYYDGFFDIIWIYNNVSVGDMITFPPRVIGDIKTVTTPLGSFECFTLRGIVGSGSIGEPDYWYSFIDLYMDSHTGVLVKILITALYPEIREMALIVIVDGNLEVIGVISSNAILIIAIVGIALFGLVLVFRYRGNIWQRIKPKSKDTHIGKKKVASRKKVLKKKEEKDGKKKNFKRG